MDSNERTFINTNVVSDAVSLYKNSGELVNLIDCDSVKKYMDDLIIQVNKIPTIDRQAKIYVEEIASRLLIIKLKIINTLNNTTADQTAVAIASIVSSIIAVAKWTDYRSISLVEWLDTEVISLFPTTLVIKYDNQVKKERVG